MNTSLFLAQIFGLVELVVGLSLLMNRKHYHKMMKSFSNNEGLMYLGGALALAVGYTVIHFHNIWEQSWIVLITIIGWGALLKGIFLLMFPNEAAVYLKKICKKDSHISYFGFLALILGGILCYYGYFANIA